MDKGSGAVRRVPFWRSLQTKFALTYIVIVAAVLILLNTYPLVVSERPRAPPGRWSCCGAAWG